MIENEMDYCGSKSSAVALVKEQRVDGSYSFQVKLLRYTLMAQVMGYPPENPSNQNNISEALLLRSVAQHSKASGAVAKQARVIFKNKPKLNKLDT